MARSVIVVLWFLYRVQHVWEYYVMYIAGAFFVVLLVTVQDVRCSWCIP